MKVAIILFSLACMCAQWTVLLAESADLPLACELKMKHEQCTSEEGTQRTSEEDNRRIVAVGDVHGSYVGLLEVLYQANITTAKDACEWKSQGSGAEDGVVLVQMGDLTDRGPGALEVLECLRILQKQAPTFNSKVIRLHGNHELWWLNGHLHQRNKVADTKERVLKVIAAVLEDVGDGSIQAAYVHTRHSVPILFVHAGITPNFYKYAQKELYPRAKSTQISAQEMGVYMNDLLTKYVGKCKSIPCKEFTHEFFEAGPDRGGSGVGGPLWSDFSMLEKAAEKGQEPRHFIQVVGHTMAYCYNPQAPGVHPPLSQAECSKGLVRAAKHLQSVCVDGGMYLGARAFLEIGCDAHFRAHEYYETKQSKGFQVKDLSNIACK